MLQNIFSISLSMSVVIAILMIASPLFTKRYAAKWSYFVWLIIAIRLVLPFNITLPGAPLKMTVPDKAVAFQTESVIPFVLVEEAFPDPSGTTPVSSGYTPVISVQDLLVLIWAMGAAALFLYHITGYRIFWKRIKPWCSDSEILSEPKVAICKKITSPMLAGFFKPVILLPPRKYTELELSAILSHEQAHFKRGDLWYKLLLAIANSIHWFNPLVHMMVHFANRDLELSCDDMVVKDKDMEFRKAYSSTILNSITNQNVPGFSTHFKGGKKDMKQRISNILYGGKKKKGILSCCLILSIVLTLGSLVGCNTGSNSNPLSFERLNPHLGKYSSEVFDSLGLKEDQFEVQTEGQQKMYSLSAVVDGKDSKASLIFYNDVLMGFQYFYNDTETAYNHAKEIRKEMENIYGAPTTYPLVSSTSSDRLDNLTSYSEIEIKDVGMRYYEDFTPEQDKDLEKRMLGDVPVNRLDLALQLSCMPNNNAFVTVRYQAIRNTLQPGN